MGHPQTNPNSLANLREPWRKGEPRAPGPGRTPTVSIVRELMKQLSENKNDEKAAKALLLHFVKGNAAAIREVMDRVDGPVVKKVELVVSSPHIQPIMVGTFVQAIREGLILEEHFARLEQILDEQMLAVAGGAVLPEIPPSEHED